MGGAFGFSGRESALHPRFVMLLCRCCVCPNAMSNPIVDSQVATHEPNRATLDDLIRQADAHFAARRMHDAAACYTHVLERHPQHVHALHRMALVHVHEDRRDCAKRYLDHVLTVAPERGDLWEHRGLVAALDGDHPGAMAFYHRALELLGDTPSLYRNLGDCLRLSNRLVEARDHYVHALALDPTLHHAARAAGQVCAELGLVESAADHLTYAWTLGTAQVGATGSMPESTCLADGLALIAALAKAGRPQQIAAVSTPLRARFCANAVALKELAYALNTSHRFEEAVSVARQGLEIDPHSGWLHLNAAYALNLLGDFAATVRHSNEAARLLPEEPHIQFDLAVTQLRFGDFERGWKQYRWHEKLPINHNLVRPPSPEWNGEPVAGRTFLLIGEQGLGDQIQFLRLADWLHRQRAVVDVWVDVPLAGLAQRAKGVRTAWTVAPPGRYDFWCRMLQMPERMKLTLQMLPVATHYIAADAERVRHWQAWLAAHESSRAPMERKKRIGLVWAGNPGYEFDRYRSLSLQTLRPLLTQPGVKWYALQKGSAHQEVEALPASVDIELPGADIGSFDDTVAILQALDLVITVDTSVAHLAGACGRPVWILLPTCTDWRWMVDRADSPWYPDARLFRQRTLGDWAPVIAEVQRALSEWCAPVA